MPQPLFIGGKRILSFEKWVNSRTCEDFRNYNLLTFLKVFDIEGAAELDMGNER